MSSMNRSVLGTALILIITLCSVFLVSTTGRSALLAIDATESGVYTLSEGSKRIVERLRRPLTLKLFFSQFAIDKTGQEVVQRYKNHHAYVRDLLYAYEGVSDGKLEFEEFDPRAFSPEEEEADRLGIARLGEIDKEGLYFGLGVESTTGARQTIPFLNPLEQSQLEYKITEAIELATNPPKKKVGILSPLPVLGAPGNPRMGQPEQLAWGSIQQLQRLYDVVQVPADADEIVDTSTDTALDYLLIIHPKQLPEQTLYAIDQFVMGGGKLLCFVDPTATIADPNQNQPQRFAPAAAHDASSNLNRLLEKWGVRMSVPSQPEETKHELVKGDTSSSLAELFYGSGAAAFARLIEAANPGVNWRDPESGRSVTIPATCSLAGDMSVAQPVQQGRNPLPSLLRLNADADKVGLVEDEPVVQGLSQSLLLLTPGVLEKTVSESGSIQFAPLITTSEDGVAYLASVEAAQQLSDRDQFAQMQATREFSETAVGEQVLAARVSGVFRTAFPDGKPDAESPDDDDDGVDEEALTDLTGDETVGPELPPESSHLPQCAESNAVIVISDVDMLTDSLAVRVQRTPIGNFAQPISSNHELMINCLDVLANSTDLMSVRSRGNFIRTFDRIEELEKQAAEKTSEEAEAIQAEIDQFAAEKKQMETELNRETQRALQAEYRTKRRELDQKIREGKRRLNELKRDEREAIEAEESKLRFINVVVVPVIFLLIGVAVAIVRWNRRMAAKGAVA